MAEELRLSLGVFRQGFSSLILPSGNLDTREKSLSFSDVMPGVIMRCRFLY